MQTTKPREQVTESMKQLVQVLDCIHWLAQSAPCKYVNTNF
jgi:hypothetical protein